MVGIILAQGDQAEKAAEEFARDTSLYIEIENPEGLGAKVDDVQEAFKARKASFVSAAKNLEGVTHIAAAYPPPLGGFLDRMRVSNYSAAERGEVEIQQAFMGPGLFETLGIKLIAGRDFREGELQNYMENRFKVVISETAARELGIANNEAALGKFFYRPTPWLQDGAVNEYEIIGVVEDHAYKGVEWGTKAMAYTGANVAHYGSYVIRLSGNEVRSSLRDLNRITADMFADKIVRVRFLDEVFEEIYLIVYGVSRTLTGFAIIALTLALSGLFGLTAYMSQLRTQEIGMRKTVGASRMQIVQLLMWQFSKPVLWAAALAMPLAWVASTTYLEFFTDRIDYGHWIILGSALLSLFIAWGVVASQTWKISNIRPIEALRYE